MAMKFNQVLVGLSKVFETLSSEVLCTKERLFKKQFLEFFDSKIQNQLKNGEQLKCLLLNDKYKLRRHSYIHTHTLAKIYVLFYQMHSVYSIAVNILANIQRHLECNPILG